jgi:hypothetical protein
MVAVNAADGVYRISGSLDGIQPGDRMVQTLWVRGLGSRTGEGLRPLAAFRSLRRLHLERISGVDLAPLAGLDLEILDIQEVRDVDLAPIARLKRLTYLQLVSVRDCRVPERLTLPLSLQILGVAYHDDLREPFAALLAAIDWDGLAGLESLNLSGDPGWPVRIDLGFITRLQRLKSLKLDCVWHGGGKPSPLEPPFDGLPRTLRRVRVDAWEPAALRRALQEHLPPGAEVSVQRREDVDDGGDGNGEWELIPPEGSVREWSTYGSLWDAMHAGDDETEYDAMEAAKRCISAAAPELLKRLDFDHESDGTGISAPTREDLESALRILGLR